MNCKTAAILFILFLIFGCSGNSDESKAGSAIEENISFISSFDYVPEHPNNGTLFGIIELGYSGFNSFIIEMDKDDRWLLKKADYGESFIAEGEITFEYVMAKIESFKKNMTEFGVSKDHINLVASSSAIRDEKVQEIASELRKLNIGLISVNATQEGNYALFATIPDELRDRAYMVDIGSGNTKISWVEKGKIVSRETYGSKYYLDGISDSLASLAVKQVLETMPDKNKDLCFMVGRVPHTMAAATNGRSGRYTILERPDIYEPNGHQEISGLNLYRSIWTERTYSYIFDWDSNFSIGVLMSVN